MKTYIALFRGINVSGQKKIKMAELKVQVENLGYQNVQTYIQSGNVVFQTKKAMPEKLETALQKMILKEYGFEVSILVKEPKDFLEILQNNPFINHRNEDSKRCYVTLLSDEPSPDKIEQLSRIDYSPEEYFLYGKNIYFFSPLGYGRAKMNNNFFEKKLKVSATTRNWRTMNKLSELAGNQSVS